MRLPDDYQIHQVFRVVCSKKTGKHRFHTYERADYGSAQLTWAILSHASWTEVAGCRPFTLEERTVSPWEAK